MPNITGTDICSLKKDDIYVYSEEARAAAGCTEGVENGVISAENAVTNIINVVLGVISLVTVVVILYGGVQYMTSTGDPTKAKKAKDIILYGVIGLIICALAFAITNFIVGVLNGSTGSA